MIRVENASKKFGEVQAVSEVSFEVNSGEIFGIVGPDGAGKSSLMKLCATTLETDSGNIFINGKCAATDLFAVRETLAYMPQKFGLYEDLTVEENAYFFGRIFGMSRSGIKKRLRTLYGFSRLEKFKDRPAGQLSGGMKQKLGLICSLIHAPKLLILDEPTNGVDPVSRREFWAILYDLLSEGVAILVSTAYMDEAERCSKIALMNNGSFMLSGNLDYIKSTAGKGFMIIDTPNPDKAYPLLEKKGYKGISRIGSRIRCFSDTSGAAATKQLLNKISQTSVVSASPTLEDCFRYLIHNANGGGNE